MKHIEYEERLIIKESDYQKIIEDINAQKLKGQHLHIENIYLDDNEYSLTDNHKMLRIRTTNNKDVELTFKSRHPSGGHNEINETLEHHPEINLNLDKEFKEYHEVARLITDRIENSCNHISVIYGKSVTLNSYNIIGKNCLTFINKIFILSQSFKCTLIIFTYKTCGNIIVFKDKYLSFKLWH